MQNYTLLEFDRLDSTNDFLKENHSYFPHMTIIRADYQEKGRGQFERTWISRPKENFLFSIMLKNIKTSKSHHIKHWILLSIIRFFQMFGVTPEFKEPNDLYVGDQKIAGILIESLSLEETFDVLVIGIGININQTDFSNLKATSLKKITGVTYDIQHEFHKLLKILISSYDEYLNP